MSFFFNFLKEKKIYTNEGMKEQNAKTKGKSQKQATNKNKMLLKI